MVFLTSKTTSQNSNTQNNNKQKKSPHNYQIPNTQLLHFTKCLVHLHFLLASPLDRSPARPKSKTNTTTKHSPNKEPTTQLVLSNYKIISAHNMQEKKIAMEKCIQIHFIVQQHAIKVAAHSRSCICICILGEG